MIDTVVLRIHNLSSYPQLKNQFYAPAQRKGSQTRALVDTSTGEFIRESAFTPAVVFHDTNRILNPVYRDHLNIPSSHYDLAYSINTEKDYMEFNFSIPKYCYSTNVIQFINPHDTSAVGGYNKLFLFLTNFLRTSMLQTPRMSDVEINRIDFCYNQMFNSKSDCLTYLEEQKKIVKKYSRTSANDFYSFSTSWMIKTRRYSFKAYHKGSEFEKHDLKELMKPKGNPLKHDLVYLKEQAEKMFRYEMTIRSPQINYFFFQYFHASKSKADNFNYNDHIYSKMWSQIIGLGYGKLYENYKKTSKYFTLNSCYHDLDLPTFTRAMKEHNTFSGKRDHKEYHYLDTVKLDQTLFTILHTEFWAFVNKFQLTNVVDLGCIKLKIDEINEQKKQKKKLGIATSQDVRSLDKTRMLMLAYIVGMGGKVMDFKEFIPNSSYYQMMHEMKQLGIHDNNAPLMIATPRTDYFDYFTYMKQYHKY